ncbi:MAG: SDR family NAD(P)-dependent oxidoreductase [Candidatus Methylophosphatis roskildensis]|nr:SDR family NAD(P)-dependent oxidoreductase [Sterolibacteriaceae bacterium]MBK9085822.1 SDR family NAD(P)-dependent oxidoreductase [Sterolibacteriaceae bacterium]
MQVKGSVVVITGGGSGIGEVVAKDMAKDGAKVVLCDMNQAGLDRVVGEIQAAGGEAIAVAGNISKEEDVAGLMDAAMTKYGAINVVFANAGIISDGLVVNTDKTGKVKSVLSLEAFKSVVEVNLVGTFLTVREAARRMVDNGCKGVLVLTTSINQTGQVGQINYSSTKASLALWPKILVGEFLMKGIQGIRVAGIAPGYTATPILLGMNQEALNTILKDVHIGRLVEPAEIAAAFRHIVENDAIDATIIEVTGGVTYGPRQRAK